MAIEFLDGFENTGTPLAPEWTLPVSGFVITSPGRFGTGLLAPGAANSSIILNLPPSAARRTIGFAYRVSAANLAYGGSTPLMLTQLQQANVSEVTLTLDALGRIQVRPGPENYSPLATSVQTLGTNWRYIEISFALGTSSGDVTVRVDGVTWLNVVGNANLQAQEPISKIRFFFPLAGLTDCGYDDLYVCNSVDDTANTGRPDNTFLGDCRVDGLVPSGDGASSQWVPSTSTTHWSLIDEVPPNTTDYVGSAVLGERDLWDLADLPGAGQRVLAVRTLMHASKNDAGVASIKHLMRDASGAVGADVAIPVGTSWFDQWGTVRPSRPSGGAWTQADINSGQLGVERA